MTRAALAWIVLIPFCTAVPACAAELTYVEDCPVVANGPPSPGCGVVLTLTQSGYDWTATLIPGSLLVRNFHIDLSYDRTTVAFVSGEYGPWLRDPDGPYSVEDPPFVMGADQPRTMLGVHFQQETNRDASTLLMQPESFVIYVAHFRPVSDQPPIVMGRGDVNASSLWIPEPSSWVLVAIGLGAVGAARLRRRRSSRPRRD